MAQTALITGGAGFIGSHLAELLIARGWHCVVLDDLSTGRRSNLAALDGNPRFRFVNGVVEDRVITSALVKDADAVFHLAAVVGVKKVMENTVGTINRNLDATRTLLDACAVFGKRTVIASTSEVYGENPQATFVEDAASIIGNSKHRRWCYAAAKLLDEFYAYAHFHADGLPVTIVRLFNTVGPRQVGRYGMVVPNFIAAAKEGRPLIVHGDGSQSRCFTAVREVARAIADLSEKPQTAGNTYNIGNNQEITIADLAKLVIKLTGSPSPIIYRSYAEIFGENFVDLQHRRPDSTALREALGYAPQTPLTAVLEELINN
ncbi:UDP-glucose 4-epimerase [Planctomycetales bacterium]|nr:UDP-glucose 4-epimerase [Planctomycetales bacterium]